TTTRPFSHHNLRDLTLVVNVVPWRTFLAYGCGRQLFGELTHFRWSGGQTLDIPDFASHLLPTYHFPVIIFSPLAIFNQHEDRHASIRNVFPCSSRSSQPSHIWHADTKSLVFSGPMG